MVASWVKVVWILIGGTVAAAGAAYVGGVFEPSPGSARVEAALQQPPAGQTGTGKEAAATDEAKADMPSTGEEKPAEGGEQMAALPPADETAEPEAPAAEPEIIVPAFDLVRVEPDGSVVIAGKAAPNATVEVIAGATVIGTADSGPGGDFAVVLDDPLKPGDYTVVLRSTTKDNIVASSAQTAIIAVPETESGQVLALVEEPGAPSRLITVPAAPQPEEEVAVKGDRPSAGSSGEIAAAPEQKPEAQAAAAEEPASDAETVAEVADAQEAAPADKQEMAAVEAPKADTAEPAAETKPAAAPRVAVEAVEIEGRKVFVAGRAEKGATVRVYANDILLGQAVASDGGRFLIEAERDLPVGDYIVRADMLSPGSADVVARAAVPFEREPGEKLAAVASQEPSKPEAGSEPAATVMADQDASGTEEKAGLTGDMAANDAGEETAKPQDTEVAALDNDDKGTMTDTSAGDGAMQSAAASTAPADSETMEATAPKLENVSGAVIIRRGDTLWQLSRRVYGRGVRYTTIYLANQGQIADPDMIWPGQVFSVPDETDEGEAADMSAVAEQMADPEDVSEDVATR